MANLNTKTISAGVGDILAVDSGIDASTARQVKDGDGTVSPFYLTTTKVGIGNSTLDHLLNLKASGTACAFSMQTTNGAFLISALSDDSNPIWRFNVNSGEQMTWAVGGARKMTMDSNGNFGIGTDTPDANLDVEGTGGSDGASGSPKIRLTNSVDSGDWDIGDVIGTIETYTADPSGNAPYIASFIKTVNEENNGTLPSGALTFGTVTYNDASGAQERMRIDSTGKVGIGTDTPDQQLHIEGGNALIQADSGASKDGIIYLGSDSGDNIGATIRYQQSGDKLGFRIAHSGDDNITLLSSGYVGIGATVPGAMLEIHPDSDVVNGLTIKDSDGSCDTNNKLINLDYSGDADLDGAKFIIFQDSDGIIGSISGDGATTIYATSSDYRLKTDCKDIVDATGTINQLKLYDFAWKKNTSKRSMGVFAHEAQAIFPSAVIGTKDAMTTKEYTDESGNIQTKDVIDAQGIDYSKFVPLLLKAVQELSAKVTALESK